MYKVDTTYWQKFRVGNLFDIHPTKAYKLTNAKLLDGGVTPVVVNSAYNNGIGGTSSQAPTENGGMITFSDTVDANTIFYQANNFIGYPHVQGLYPIGEHSNKWTTKRLQFFAAIFRKTALTKGFDYGNKFRRDIAVNLKVALPISSPDNPDWDYMDKYIQSIEDDTKSRVEMINNVMQEAYGVKSQLRINTSSWRRFHLYDDNLFSIDSGNKLDKVKMSHMHPTINFVGRANVNNGVTDYIDEIEGLKPYDAGCLTISLGGEYLGSCFIQEKPFYTSQNVNVLIPKHQMSDYCKRFIATMIFREGRLHYKAFVDELNRHMKRDFSILLPVTKDNTPDWDYMESYMRGVEQRAKTAIQYMAS